jgi:hypothetical protein
LSAGEITKARSKTMPPITKPTKFKAGDMENARIPPMPAFTKKIKAAKEWVFIVKLQM